MNESRKDIVIDADPVAAVGTFPTTRRLRAALRANAVFSLVTGLALLVGGWFAAAPWGVEPAFVLPLVGVGLGALGLVAGSWIAVRPPDRLRRWSAGVAAADVAWVAASAALLVWNPDPLTASAAVAVATVAVAVGVITVWEIGGLVAARAGDPMADLEVVQAVRRLDAAPADVWPLLTDHDLYGRVAPNLSKVEVISDPGGPLRRRCSNTSGNAWEETCTLWDEGRRFAVHVDTSDYPYPLAVMRGLWQVDPAPAGGPGSIVTMRFAFQAKPTVKGGLFAILFRSAFPPVLGRIFRGWRRSLPTTPAHTTSPHTTGSGSARSGSA